MKRTPLVLLTVVVLGLGGLGVAGAAGLKGDPPTRDAWLEHRGSSAEAAKSLDASPSVAAAETPIGDRGLRVAGNDRFETAVAISQSVWDATNAAVVFLATGANFPDALAAGPSTVLSGPLLLVHKDSLPQVTADEITRLQPCMVVAFGGTGVISDAVIQQAQALTSATC